MKLRFGLRTLALIVAVCAVLALAAKYYVDSLPGPTIPFGTNRALVAAIREAFRNPPVEIEAMRPGWAGATPTPAMKKVVAFGDDAIPVLIANLHNRDRVMRIQVYEMLAMMDAESAVPELLNALRFDDGTDDFFIVAKLAEITEHPEGYRFYRTWFSKRTQQEAVQAYRTWHTEHQSKRKMTDP